MKMKNAEDSKRKGKRAPPRPRPPLPSEKAGIYK